MFVRTRRNPYFQHYVKSELRQRFGDLPLDLIMEEELKEARHPHEAYYDLEGHVRVCIYNGFFQEDVPECIYGSRPFQTSSTKVLALRVEVPKRSSGLQID